MKFFLLNKVTGEAKVLDSAARVSIWMLGRSIEDWFVVKCDDAGERIVKFVDAECGAVQRACETA